MADTTVRGKIGKDDISFASGGAGAAETFDRATSTGGTLTQEKLDASHIRFRATDAAIEEIQDGSSNTIPLRGSTLNLSGAATIAGAASIAGETTLSDMSVAGFVKNTAAGVLSGGNSLAANDMPSAIDATKIADGTVTNAEFQYLGSVTSDIQTQIDAKLPSADNATQTDQEAATATDHYVTPGTQQYHPSACKCFVKIDGTATPANYVGTPYNVTSITDDGTGTYTITIDTDFSDAHYTMAGMATNGGGNELFVQVESGQQAAGTVQVSTATQSGTIQDALCGVSMFGDLP